MWEVQAVVCYRYPVIERSRRRQLMKVIPRIRSTGAGFGLYGAVGCYFQGGPVHPLKFLHGSDNTHVCLCLANYTITSHALWCRLSVEYQRIAIVTVIHTDD